MMKIRFIHIADLHLGYAQYGSEERYWDYFRSFQRCVDDVIEERVDFLLIAGDIFHQRSISPQTLMLATNQLERLRSAGIPVVAVMGNHEQPHYRERFSWLDYLAGRGLLTLLKATYEEGELALHPCQNGRGGYIDLGPARIYGIGYHGSAMSKVVGDLPALLERLHAGGRPPLTILLMHAGVEGMMPRIGAGFANLTYEQISPLRSHIDYVALGHIHKPDAREEWLFNPGCLEPTSFPEAELPGGAIFVEIEMGSPPAVHVERRRYNRRPFLQRRFPVSEYDSPEALYAGLRRFLAGEDPPASPAPAPVVEFILDGVLHFEAQSLDEDLIQATLREHYQPLALIFRNRAVPAEYEVDVGSAEMSRTELERHVLTELLQRDERYRPQAERWAGVVHEIKSMAVAGAAPEAIVDYLRHTFSEHAPEGEGADLPR